MSQTVQDLKLALSTLMESAKGSLPADTFEAQQWGMAGSHACIINGLLNVYMVSKSHFLSFIQIFITELSVASR